MEGEEEDAQKRPGQSGFGDGQALGETGKTSWSTQPSSFGTFNFGTSAQTSAWTPSFGSFSGAAFGGKPAGEGTDTTPATSIGFSFGNATLAVPTGGTAKAKPATFQFGQDKPINPAPPSFGGDTQSKPISRPLGGGQQASLVSPPLGGAMPQITTLKAQDNKDFSVDDLNKRANAFAEANNTEGVPLPPSYPASEDTSSEGTRTPSEYTPASTGPASPVPGYATLGGNQGWAEPAPADEDDGDEGDVETVQSGSLSVSREGSVPTTCSMDVDSPFLRHAQLTSVDPMTTGSTPRDSPQAEPRLTSQPIQQTFAFGGFAANTGPSKPSVPVGGSQPMTTDGVPTMHAVPPAAAVPSFGNSGGFSWGGQQAATPTTPAEPPTQTTSFFGTPAMSKSPSKTAETGPFFAKPQTEAETPAPKPAFSFGAPAEAPGASVNDKPAYNFSTFGKPTPFSGALGTTSPEKSTFSFGVAAPSALPVNTDAPMKSSQNGFGSNALQLSTPNIMEGHLSGNSTESGTSGRRLAKPKGRFKRAGLDGAQPASPAFGPTPTGGASGFSQPTGTESAWSNPILTTTPLTKTVAPSFTAPAFLPATGRTAAPSSSSKTLAAPGKSTRDEIVRNRQKIRILNEQFLAHASTSVKADPMVDLAPTMESYLSFLKSIMEEFKELVKKFDSESQTSVGVSRKRQGEALEKDNVDFGGSRKRRGDDLEKENVDLESGPRKRRGDDFEKEVNMTVPAFKKGPQISFGVSQPTGTMVAAPSVSPVFEGFRSTTTTPSSVTAFAAPTPTVVSPSKVTEPQTPSNGHQFTFAGFQATNTGVVAPTIPSPKASEPQAPSNGSPFGGFQPPATSVGAPSIPPSKVSEPPATSNGPQFNFGLLPTGTSVVAPTIPSSTVSEPQRPSNGPQFTFAGFQPPATSVTAPPTSSPFGGGFGSTAATTGAAPLFTAPASAVAPPSNESQSQATPKVTQFSFGGQPTGTSTTSAPPSSFGNFGSAATTSSAAPTFNTPASTGFSFFGNTQSSATPGPVSFIPPPQTPSNPSNDNTEDADGDEANKEDQIGDALMRGQGEEQERTVHQVRAKVFSFDKESGQWKPAGVGQLRVNKHIETGKARLLHRADGSGRVLLNAAVYQGMKFTLKANNLSFAIVLEGGVMQQTLVRVKAASDASALLDAIESARE
ncbi:hypothetical protein SpCBS45565_g02091 [Spizellomyces sp. 'palustris']|nr:hypothetical protein SpCBS45565_g02091 [Spizellomyces sp. 'palustris']